MEALLLAALVWLTWKISPRTLERIDTFFTGRDWSRTQPPAPPLRDRLFKRRH